MLVVDCIDGVRLQTENLLSQVYRERVLSVLTINKIDICFGELQVDGEEAYKSFQKVIGVISFLTRTPDSGQTKTQGLGHANRVINLCIESEKELLWPILTEFDVTLSEAEKEFMGIELMDRVMKKWLPAANALLDMVTFHLPSPHVAQIYRGDKLYTLSKTAILMPSYCIRIQDDLSTGQQRLLGIWACVFSKDYNEYENQDLGDCPEDPYLHGEKQEVVEYVPYGNIVALVGLDQFITKTAMLTSESDSWVYPIRAMRFSLYPVVRVTVECKVNEDLPKLSEALNHFAKADPAIICTVEESGIHVVTTVGDKHLEMCLNNLRNDFLNGTEVIVSEPFVAYCETVSSESSHTVISMYLNTQNRLHMEALPLDISIVGAIEDGQIVTLVNPEDCKNILCEECGWYKRDIEKIWFLGPDASAPNMIVGKCNVDNHVKICIVGGFCLAVKHGALAGEAIWGVRFDLTDVVYSRAHGLDGRPSLAQCVVHASVTSQKLQ
ncbi:hypothetical protein LXL04_023939 [Taraxacum kok-saghyz]